MMIHEITEKVGRYQKRKRIGRGEGSGSGCTAGRGHKGARSRAGWSARPGYEGGQMPLFRRLPKRGFSNVQFQQTYAVVNIKALEALMSDGEDVTPERLAKAGLIRNAKSAVKILGEGELTRKLTVTAARCSAAARRKIEAAGGSVNETGRGAKQEAAAS